MSDLDYTPQTKETIKDDEYFKYYSHYFYCLNCGDRTHRYIRKGVLVKCVDVKCDKCGCPV